MDFTNKELLEAWDWESGTPSGLPVARGESYKKGISHEGVHLWIIRAAASSYEILFQHRSHLKELFPGCLDITVGGHVPFGLKENKIQKEAMEELGISPSDADMTDLGYARYEEITGEYVHREFQHVYIMRDERPLEGYRFNDGEVTGLCPVPGDYVLSLFDKDSHLSVPYYDGKYVSRKIIRKKDFHPLLFSSIMKEYMTVLFASCTELMTDGKVKTRMPGVLHRAAGSGETE
ncbi:MAG TPA: hypothetical protein PK514_01305 [Spirochaetota bacterium]|nr:hypothetical protein [Spirochaetota bacterium]